jgi:hypothetical protein
MKADAVGSRWSEEKAAQWYQQQPWLVGGNFAPSTAINQLEMWQVETFDPNTIDRELGWAASLGMNTARVFLHDLLWQDSEGFLKRVDAFLAIADKHHIRPMLVLFDSCWDPQPRLGRQRDPRPHVHNSGWVQGPSIDILKDPCRYDSLESYAKGVLTRFKDDPRILMWDLYNEPGNAGGNPFYKPYEPNNKEELAVQFLDKVYGWARQVNPSQPLTAGVWVGQWKKGGDVSRLNQYMLEHADIITFHNYDGLTEFASRVEVLREYHRPLICTEYMARTNNSIFKTHLPYLNQQHIGAINWGLVAGKTQTQYPWESWDKTFTAEPKIWFHDIFKPDGTPFDNDEIELFKQLTGVKKSTTPVMIKEKQ